MNRTDVTTQQAIEQIRKAVNGLDRYEINRIGKLRPDLLKLVRAADNFVLAYKDRSAMVPALGEELLNTIDALASEAQ